MPKKKPIKKIQVQKENNGTRTGAVEFELSITDESFITSYFDHNMNGTQAYLADHPKAAYSTARSMASKLLAKENIRARIDQILKENAMGRNEVLARLGSMARASHQPFIHIDDDGFAYFNFADPLAKRNLHLVKKIRAKRERRIISGGNYDDPETWEGEWVEVELHDSMRALELIGKHYKMFGDKHDMDAGGKAEKIEIPGSLIARDFVDVYHDIMQGKHTEYTFAGGRGSLKSTFVSEIITILLANNSDWHALILRQVKDSLRESVYSQMMWAIDTLGLSEKFRGITSPMEITYLPTGQKIYFRGADDPSKIKSIKPPFGYIALLWFEEFDQYHGPESIRNIAQSALRGGDRAYQFASYNTPRTTMHWVHKYIKMPDPGRLDTFSNYLNVPAEWLGKVFLDKAEHLREVAPDAYDHEYGGIANGVGGMVFENVELRTITDQEIKQFDRIKMGVDWGYYPHPFSWVKLHYDAAREIIYVFDEYVVFKKGNKATADHLKKEKRVGKNDLIIADSAEPKSVGDYVKFGLNARGAEKGAESVRYSIRWLQSRARIVIDPTRAPKHAQQFTEYEYLRTKDGEVMEEFPDVGDDCIDDVRYALNLEWRQRGK